MWWCCRRWWWLPAVRRSKWESIFSRCLRPNFFPTQKVGIARCFLNLKRDQKAFKKFVTLGLAARAIQLATTTVVAQDLIWLTLSCRSFHVLLHNWTIPGSVDLPVHWECCFFSRAFWQWSNRQSTWRWEEVCKVRYPVTEKENVRSQKIF